MQQYTITWEIELDADSALEAAQEAHAIMLDPDALAPCFDVTGAEGTKETIDLYEIGLEERGLL